MKNIILLAIFLFCFTTNSQSQDLLKIERAVQDYVEGFYEGDTMKIIRSIHPELYKKGYGIDRKTKAYKNHTMSYDRAIGYARDVINNPKYAAPKDAVRKIEILDAQDKIANVKLTAYWGIDYLFLVREGDKWMITQVLWQALEK